MAWSVDFVSLCISGSNAAGEKVLRDGIETTAFEVSKYIHEMAPGPSEGAKAEYERLKALSDNGTYVPRVKLRALMEQINGGEGSVEMQRMRWDTLKKEINGLVNKVNVSNIRSIVVELFKLNLHRGMGLLVRTLMKAQNQAPTFTPVYASLVAILNSKIPEIGKLLVSRLVLQFRKAFKRNISVLSISSTTFLAHLCNQQVCHEIIVLEIMRLLLLHPTDDSIDICCSMLKQCGLFLQEMSSNAVMGIYEQLRVILQEGKIQKRTQFLIEISFQIRRDGYKDHPVIAEGLDLVDEEDLVTHEIRLDDKLKAQDNLNVFAVDEHYDENEEKYNQLRHEILGSDDEEEKEEAEGEDAGEDDQLENEYDGEHEVESHDEQPSSTSTTQTVIKDMTETNLTNFRKTIYLTLKGSMSADEAVHKILKLRVKTEEEVRVVEVIVQGCSQERTYTKYYGSVGEKLSGQSSSWADAFNQVFKETYETIHRLEPNQLRNVSKFWGHMLSSDALGWESLECIKLTESDTSSAGRIFLKFLFQELVEELGIPHLKERLTEDFIAPYIEGIFPHEDSHHLQFSINYFTAIGLGILTDDMRDALDAIKRKRIEERGRSLSRSGTPSRSPSYSRTPSPYSRTPSRSPVRGRSDRRREGGFRGRSQSPSRSPASARAGYVGRSRSPNSHRGQSPAISGGDYRDSVRYRSGALNDQEEEFKKSNFYSRQTTRQQHARHRDYH